MSGIQKGNITKVDVARIAGVSPSTVSNVFNNSHRVSKDLREKVENAVRELNYTPNMVARSLRTRSSKHIGLILDEMSNPHAVQFANGAQYEADQNGYIFSVNVVSRGIDSVIEDYISRHIDGFIINSYTYSMSDRIRNMLDASGIIHVHAGGVNDSFRYFIGFDYYSGMKTLYKHLAEKGHKKITLITGLSNARVGRDYHDTKVSAFEWCCNNIGDGYDEKTVVFGQYPYPTNYDAGYNYCRDLLNRGLEFSAIIIGNDYMALGALQYLRENNVKIPEDIAVASFDNTMYSLLSYPRLTSIGAPVYEGGRSAVQCILNQLSVNKNERKGIEKWFDMQLVERESTAGRRISNI